MSFADIGSFPCKWWTCLHL